MVKLGSKVRDTVTGFTGIASARSEYLHGTPRVLIESTGLDRDGNLKRGEWFDEPRVESVPVAKKRGG